MDKLKSKVRLNYLGMKIDLNLNIKPKVHFLFQYSGGKKKKERKI